MYLNKKQIIERGWSSTLIEKLLGEPNVKNRLSKYCYERLYFIPRIEKIEQTDDFKSAQEKYLKRRATGKAAAERQAEDRLKLARTMTIRVAQLAPEKVLEDAIDHFNCRRGRRRWWDDYESLPAGTNSEDSFLQRITVNYIRHELTSYDSKIFNQKGRIGGGDAVPIIRRRVFEEIAIIYPHLSDECDRQMISRGLKSHSELKLEFLSEQMELPF